MEFDLEDIKPGLQVQVVAGMYFDRRVFLVANTGEKRPMVIPITPTKPGQSPPTWRTNREPVRIYDRRRSVQAAVVVRQLSPTNLRQGVEGDVFPDGRRPDG